MMMRLLASQRHARGAGKKQDGSGRSASFQAAEREAQTPRVYSAYLLRTPSVIGPSGFRSISLINPVKGST